MTREVKPTLLIAEDDPHIRFLIEAAAKRTGFFEAIVTAGDGEEALRKIRGCEPVSYPDLIWSDLSMPRMTGLELLRALKADPETRPIPVAIVTSSDLPHDRDDALAAGACVFEAKPHGFEALMQLVTELRNNCCQPAHAA